MKLKEKYYEVMAQEFDANYLAFSYNERPWCDPGIEEVFMARHSGTITKMENKHIEFAVSRKEFALMGKRQFEEYKKDRKRIDNERKTHLNCSKRMTALLEKFNRMDFKKLSNKELANYFQLIYYIDQELCFSGFSFVAIDYENNLLTNHINKRLLELVVDRNLSKRVAYYFSILTTPADETFTAKERKDFLKLALEVKKKKLSDEEKLHLIETHRKKYSWITFGFNGPELKNKFYEEELKDLLESSESIESRLLDLKKEKEKKKKEIKKAKKELKISRDDAYFFDLAREIVFLKGLRKETMVLSFFLLSKLVKEVSKRSFVAKNLLGFSTLPEIKNYLLNGNPFDERELQKRSKVMVAAGTLEDGYEIYSGAKARKLFHKHVIREKVSRKKNQLNGQIASPGLVKGIVKIVNNTEDMDRLFTGDILVSYATQPELVPAMKRSSGIITEQGGMTCHAAIVSRELNKPCVIGVNKATSYLNDGDEIELDAYHGIIRVLKRADKK